MIKIDLRINGKTFGYYAECVPRIGEFIYISHDVISGEFEVKRVTHRVYQERKTKDVFSYVIVEASVSK